MSMYNQKTKRAPEKIINHQGGEGFKLSPKLELISLLATGISGNKYYETLDDRSKRLLELVGKVAKTPKEIEFVAKALVYTRSVIGQRSVTHLGAVGLVPHLSGMELGKRFFSKRNRKAETGGIVHRLDDMLEIAAAYFHFNPGKPLPGAIKKGFRNALEHADTYELAKYQGKGKAISLVDIVNLVHPRPDDNMIEVFEKLMKGELTQFNTVEDKNTKSGQEVAAKVISGEITKTEAEVQVKQAKKENFSELISTRKIGYFALIRNLRNILKTGINADTVDDIVAMLTDKKLIKQSLIFPHQIDIAMEIMVAEGVIIPLKILKAIDTAYELAIPNLAELFPLGNTAVVVDTSGSMWGMWGSGCKVGKINLNKNPIEKAALIGATLAKGIGADLYQFATMTEDITYNRLDTVNTIKKSIINSQGRVGHGTNFSNIFTRLNGTHYDRIFIISDLQGGDSIVSGSSYQSYKKKYGMPYIYTIDIQGYGSTMFKQEKKVCQLYGYSQDIYEMAKKVELDPRALLKEIEAIVI